MIHDLIVHPFWFSFGVLAALLLFANVLRFLSYVGTMLFYLFSPLYAVTVGPIVYGIKKVVKSRCPDCGRFFAMRREKTEVTGEREVVRNVPVTERGVLYSNRLLAPNQDIEFTHRVDTRYVETTVTEYWTCSACGHRKETTGSFEYAGTLDD